MDSKTLTPPHHWSIRWEPPCFWSDRLERPAIHGFFFSVINQNTVSDEISSTVPLLLVRSLSVPTYTSTFFVNYILMRRSLRRVVRELEDVKHLSKLEPVCSSWTRTRSMWKTTSYCKSRTAKVFVPDNFTEIKGSWEGRLTSVEEDIGKLKNS